MVFKNLSLTGFSKSKKRRAKYLDTLFDESWDNKPLYSKSDLKISPEPEKIFKAVAKVCDHEETLPRDQIRLFCNRKILKHKFAKPYLPTLSDESFQGYNKRAETCLNRAEYALVINNLQLGFEDEGKFFKEFTDEIRIKSGKEIKAIEASIFFGNYLSTPFGVHQEDASVLYFPIINQKQMYFWSEESIISNQNVKGATKESDFENYDYSVLTSPGESVFWPANYWHVATGKGEFHAAWGFGFWFS